MKYCTICRPSESLRCNNAKRTQTDHSLDIYGRHGMCFRTKNVEFWEDSVFDSEADYEPNADSEDSDDSGWWV